MNLKRDDCLSPGPVAHHTPAVVDKLLDINGVKPQGGSARSHLDSRKIRSTLARRVLNHPRNADPQLLRDIPCPNQLSDGGPRDFRGRFHSIAPSIASFALVGMPFIYGIARILSNDSSASGSTTS